MNRERFWSSKWIILVELLVVISAIVVLTTAATASQKPAPKKLSDSGVSGRTHFESFDKGCGGWLSDRGYRLNVWDGVAYCYGPWYLDCWHAPPGAGYLHLVMWIHTHPGRLHEYYPGYPGNEFVKQKQSTSSEERRVGKECRSRGSPYL